MLPSIGPYRIVRQLGEGGMSLVFEAIHESIERRVAIKTLKPDSAKSQELLTRFFNEARAVNRIEHSSLVQISDYGQTDDGTAFLVMEYLRGETLRQRLDRLQRSSVKLSVHQTVLFSWQVAEALAAAHEKDIAHRDLKPDNLMLIADPSVPGGERVKILDFGIAKLRQLNQVVTLRPCLLGTPIYMSPEQCRSAADIDGQTDVYSMAVLMFEMLTGRPPYRSETIEGLLAQHLFMPPPPLAPLAPLAPAPLLNLVERMLVKEPARRPSMPEIAAQLGELLAFHQARPTQVLELSELRSDSNKPPSQPLQRTTHERLTGELRRPRRRLLTVGLSAVLTTVVLLGGLRLHQIAKGPARLVQMRSASRSATVEAPSSPVFVPAVAVQPALTTPTAGFTPLAVGAPRPAVPQGAEIVVPSATAAQPARPSRSVRATNGASQPPSQGQSGRDALMRKAKDPRREEPHIVDPFN